MLSVHNAREIACTQLYIDCSTHRLAGVLELETKARVFARLEHPRPAYRPARRDGAALRWVQVDQGPSPPGCRPIQDPRAAGGRAAGALLCPSLIWRMRKATSDSIVTATAATVAPAAHDHDPATRPHELMMSFFLPTKIHFLPTADFL